MPPEHSAAGGDAEKRRPRIGKRGRLLIIVGAALALCLIAGYAIVQVVASNSDNAADATTQSTQPTASVARGDITVETRAAGILSFSNQVPLEAGPTGTVTMLPSVDTVITAGQTIYTVNSRPVTLLAGTIPAWRDFASGMSNGEDIRQLEQNLAGFGLFFGDVDDVFTAMTRDAIVAWQQQMSLPETGTLSHTDVLFAPDPIRVSEAKVRVGQQVSEGTTIMAVSSTSTVVTVDLKVSQRSLAQQDAPVTVALPSGDIIDGTVALVGPTVERTGADGSSSTVVPVTIAITDQEATTGFDRAGVQVLFATASSKDSLTVPVEALVPLDDSQFAVEVPDRAAPRGLRRLPVTVGTFGAGRVAISGNGITEGLKVIVPRAVSEQ